MLIEDKITRVESVGISYSLDVHPYHQKFGDMALDNWAKEKLRKPKLFNGNVLLFSKLDLIDEKLECVCHSVPYSTYLHWRRSDQKIGYHLFPLPFIISSEGYPILGKMAEHTFHSGQFYSPAGAFDEDDIEGTRVDPFRNMMREVKEETGLNLESAKPETDFYFHLHEQKIALVKVLRFQMNANEILSQINLFIKNDSEAELESVIALSNSTEYPEDMPYYMKPILDWYFKKAI